VGVAALLVGNFHPVMAGWIALGETFPRRRLGVAPAGESNLGGRKAAKQGPALSGVKVRDFLA
jgi:hypothetical protein